MGETIFWWGFNLACVFAFFFSYGMIGPELTFLLAGLLPLWQSTLGPVRLHFHVAGQLQDA